jgi:predicted transcriptional regulator
MRRRADGTLEAEVLRALWDLDRPATPREVLEETGGHLAYTSIATTLGRLLDKGLVTRTRRGRAFRYEPLSEIELTTRRIRGVLDAASDRETALTGFVQALDPQETARLLEILDES